MCFTVNGHRFERPFHTPKLNHTDRRIAFKKEKKKKNSKLKTSNTAKVTVTVLFTYQLNDQML